MKTTSMMLLILFVAVCNAAKFPFHLRRQGVRDEIVPVSANNLGNEASLECTFCTDFMLSDCICEDVTFCRSRSCYVPKDCECDSEEGTTEEMPQSVEEEIIPVTAAILGNESSEDCQYCESMDMFGDCDCGDVDWCRGKQCTVPAKCSDKCPKKPE
ncbi:hypothetical protein OS493_003753 [Desmophyllum pertusum]|uniref:Uncharacterized protein n=1 Tax=Desmophyllum pertusum TaxID=174260 RepID=A0A9X0DCU6_9CNID|nr:hypothetical protein OS493_003753 [Desmophyllum pertusum]